MIVMGRQGHLGSLYKESLVPRREAAPSGPILVTSGVIEVGKTSSTCSLFTTTLTLETVTFYIYIGGHRTSRAVQMATPRKERKSSLKLKMLFLIILIVRGVFILALSIFITGLSVHIKLKIHH